MLQGTAHIELPYIVQVLEESRSGDSSPLQRLQNSVNLELVPTRKHTMGAQHTRKRYRTEATYVGINDRRLAVARAKYVWQIARCTRYFHQAMHATGGAHACKNGRLCINAKAGRTLPPPTGRRMGTGARTKPTVRCSTRGQKVCKRARIRLIAHTHVQLSRPMWCARLMQGGADSYQRVTKLHSILKPHGGNLWGKRKICKRASMPLTAHAGETVKA